MLRTISLRLGRVNRERGFLSHRHVPVAKYTGSTEGSHAPFKKDARSYGSGNGGSSRPGPRRDSAPRSSGFGIRKPDSDRQSWGTPTNENPRWDRTRDASSDTTSMHQAASSTDQQPQQPSIKFKRGVFWDRQNFMRDERKIRPGDMTWKNPDPKSFPSTPRPSQQSRLVTSRDEVEVVEAETFAQLADAAGPTSASSSTTIIPASPEGQKVIADLDDFFAGHADPVLAAPASTDLPQPIQRRQSPPAPSSGVKPLATYTPPRESGVEMVKRLMLEHKFLTTQQIFQMGTEGLKPVIQADHVIEPNGRIRMKRVATMREGRRPWVPPAAPSFPEHPFRSVR